MTKTATVHAQQKWEYMELTRKTEAYLVNELNELGQAGWELVSTAFHRDTRAGAAADVWTAFLKRPHAAGQGAAERGQVKAAAAPAPAPANVNQPARLVPSSDGGGEEFEFADAPPEEETPAEEVTAEETSGEK